MRQDTNEVMGVIVFGEAVSGVLHSAVVEAAAVAEFPEKIVRPVAPRFAFQRAINHYQRDKRWHFQLRDKIRDDDEALEYSLLARHGSGGETAYGTEAVIRWDKLSQQIRVLRAPDDRGVDTDSVLERTREFFEDALRVRTASDINGIVKRYLGETCRQLPLRAGVYFIPRSSAYRARAVQKFYDHLQCPYWVVPVGYSERDAGDIQAAICADLRKRMRSLRAEIEQAKATEGGLGARAGQTKLRQLSRALREYRELVESTRSQMGDLLEDCGISGQLLAMGAQPLETLARMAASGTPIPQTVVDLHVAATSTEDTEAAAHVARLIRAAQPDVDIANTTAQTALADDENEEQDEQQPQKAVGIMLDL